MNGRDCGCIVPDCSHKREERRRREQSDEWRRGVMAAIEQRELARRARMIGNSFDPYPDDGPKLRDMTEFCNRPPSPDEPPSPARNG